MDYSKHTMLTCAPAMQEIVKALHRCCGLNYFNYVKNFNDDSRICLTTNAEWADRFCNNKLYLVAPFERDKEKYESNEYIYWPTMQDHVIYQEALQCKVSHAVTIVKKGKEFDEFYHFGSNVFDYTTYDNVVNNRDILNYFILYFKDKAEKLIKKSQILTFPEYTKTTAHKEIIKNMPSPNEINQPDDIFNILKFKKYYLGAEFGDAYLTQKEINILRWVIIGKSASEIAILLNANFRTIQQHIENIKIKTNCTKTAELCYKIGCSEVGKILKKIIS